MGLTPDQTESVENIVLRILRAWHKEEVLPLHQENQKSDRELREAVASLKEVMAKWAGVVSTLLVLLILFEAMFNGACNKYKITAADSSISSALRKIPPIVP